MMQEQLRQKEFSASAGLTQIKLVVPHLWMLFSVFFTSTGQKLEFIKVFVVQ